MLPDSLGDTSLKIVSEHGNIYTIERLDETNDEPKSPNQATAAGSSSYSPKRTLIFLLTPRICIVIPNSTSAMLIVRLACVMTMNCESV